MGRLDRGLARSGHRALPGEHADNAEVPSGRRLRSTELANGERFHHRPPARQEADHLEGVTLFTCALGTLEHVGVTRPLFADCLPLPAQAEHRQHQEPAVDMAAAHTVVCGRLHPRLHGRDRIQPAGTATQRTDATG